MHENAIDLQLAKLELPQIVQAAVSAAEVVDGEVDPHLSQPLQHRRHDIGVSQQKALGELQLEHAGVKTGIAQDVLDRVREGLLAELDRRDIHCDRQAGDALFLPSSGLRAGFS